MRTPAEHHHLRLVDGGEAFEGAYYLDGVLLHVVSSYGSVAVQLRQAEPERLAKRLFADILDAWCGR